jgi:hypothetical protein
MTKKLPTHIAKTAHHDMTAHQRNPHLQHPITKQHSQATEPGVTGHDRCQETGDIQRDRQVNVAWRGEEEQLQLQNTR